MAAIVLLARHRSDRAKVSVCDAQCAERWAVERGGDVDDVKLWPVERARAVECLHCVACGRRTAIPERRACLAHGVDGCPERAFEMTVVALQATAALTARTRRPVDDDAFDAMAELWEAGCDDPALLVRQAIAVSGR